MKAFLLAAGLGTRLRPLTDTVPKCMLPINGTPLLDLWLDRLADAGVDEVTLNLHHLAEVVRDHVAGRSGPPRVRTVLEPELLGSAGTLLANRDWVAGESSFLVCYADNLTDFDLGLLVEAHRTSGLPATIGVFRAPDPRACGIVETGPDGVVTAFEEKPAEPRSDTANAGIYAFSPSVLDLVEGPAPRDIGYHLLPHLVGRAGTVVVDGYLLDIGTPAAYERAQREWRERTSA